MKRLRRFDAARFNRACAIFALAYLTLTLGGRLAMFRWSNQDFPQYYMGGVMARLGAWDSLYPIPLDDPQRNPGFIEGSLMKPAYEAQTIARGVGPQVRYMQPPPFSLLLIPLAFFTYQQAYVLWTFVLIAFTWIICLQASKIYRLCRGQITHGAGLILIVIAMSLTAHRWVRVQNMSPIIGALLAGAVLALHDRKDARGPIYIGIGIIAKYATAVLLPLYIAMRRWKSLLSLAIFAIAAMGVSLLVMGRAPFDEYVTKIAPTLSRTNDIPENQGVPGLVVRLMKTNGLSPAASKVTAVARVAVLLVILFLLARVPLARWQDPPVLFAGASALIAWLLIFSPIFWEHYTAYLAPFWGWLAWIVATNRSPWQRSMAGAAIAMSLAPFTIITTQLLHRPLPEPLGELQLLATFLIIILASMTLIRSRQKIFNYVLDQNDDVANGFC